MIIKRARGHRLYSVAGEKIIDLSMDWGRAVLGHRPNGLSLAIKNGVDRGLYAGYDNIYTARIIKDFRKRFPAYSYITILEHEHKVTDYFNTTISDPLFHDCNGSQVAYWRPFIDAPDSNNLVILYPMPGLNSVTLLVSKEDTGLESDAVSPILLSGILRSLYDYDMELKTFDKNEYNRYKNIKDSVLKAPYLIFSRDKKEYKDLCNKGLEVGILLNDRSQIIVLSNDFSSGEHRKILNLIN